MKKIILSLVMIFVLIAAAGCSLKSGDTIKFTSLPQPIYTQGHDVDKFKNDVNIIINDGLPISLKEAEEKGVIISGLNFDKVGSHTLVVVYNSVSLTFDYKVVELVEAYPVATLEELRLALNNQEPIIELTDDITTSTKITINYGVTIYGNGHTVTLSKDTETERLFEILYLNNSKLAFYDINVDNKSTKGSSRGIIINDSTNSEFVFDNCSVNVSHYAYQLGGRTSNLIVNIKNGSSTKSWSAVYCWSNNSTINIVDSELNGEKTTGGLDFGVFATDSEDADTGKNNTFNIENCVLTAKTVDGSMDKVYVVNNIGKYYNSSQKAHYQIETEAVATGNKYNFKNCNLNPEVDEYWNIAEEGIVITIDGQTVAYEAVGFEQEEE